MNKQYRVATKSVKHTLMRSVFAPGSRLNARLMMAGAFGTLALSAPRAAHALNLYDGTMSGNNLEINLTTTVAWTPIWRVASPSSTLTSVADDNQNEGDLDFQHGLVSDEFSILPILDIKDGLFGAHLSGEAYLNTSYLGTNQNDQPGTLNPISVAKNDDFTSATRNVDGENARLLDAFVYGSQEFGDQTVSLKIGRQTLLWGQSLYLSNNGIAAGMAPVDIITANNNPNAQTQQIIQPTGQVVLTYQPNPILELQAYYQFEWQHDVFQGVGAYFSTADILDKGGQRQLLGQSFGFPPQAITALRIKDISPEHQNGQFGIGVMLTLGNYDLGLYTLRYDSKAPTVYLDESAAGLNYNLVYPRDIYIEGTSVSTTVGPVNVAAETSFRQHMNLATLISFPTANSNANSNPAYPTGDTWAAQTSFIYVSPGIPLDPGGVTTNGEIGFNHVISYTGNKANIESVATGSLKRSSTAADLVVVATPTYYNVLPNLQLGFPIGLSYNLYGRSEVDATENQGTGSVNVGVTATYRTTWIASITYNRYIGKPDVLLQGEPQVADRDYVLLNLQHSF